MCLCAHRHTHRIAEAIGIFCPINHYLSTRDWPAPPATAVHSNMHDSLVAVSQIHCISPQPRLGVARPGFHAERSALCPLSSSGLSASSHPSDWVLFQSSRRPGIYSTLADLIRHRLQTATLGTIILGTAVVGGATVYTVIRYVFACLHFSYEVSA